MPLPAANLDWSRSQLAFHREAIRRLVGKLRKERAWQAGLRLHNPGASPFFTSEEQLLVGELEMHRKAMGRVLGDSIALANRLRLRAED